MSLRPTVRRYATGALVVLALTALPAQGRSDEASARQQLDSLGEEIQAASERLDSTAEARSDAERKLRDVEVALADMHARLDDVQAQRRKLTEESEALKQRRTRLETTRQAQLDALGTQLAALYRLGDSPQLKLLLNQGNPAELDRMQAYLNRLSRARNQRLADIARLDDALTQNAARLADRRQRLDDANQALKEESATLAQRTAKRRDILATLGQREQSQGHHLAELQVDHKQAEQRLRQIREQMARLASPTPSTQMAQTRGDLPWPVQGTLRAGFQRQKGVHQNGITIGANAGTPVKAVHEGRVVFADWIRGFGNLLIIDHGDHIMTLYAHLQRFTHGPGEKVASGDVIGYVGNSGGQPRAALYFEVRRNGEPINPKRWIARR
ncbi:murein hydrolase activator EnvC family protein [Vreelandella subglaciescola]|uniref:Septal ring factor EnvC, activator of murein hydrolases AmiA and AmiB n=1 Tax=Vreelandella subglaciescola TaxID=29571 RepID=A0A1M7HDN2_9GAMM|nr:peptidoglycan DD-metalloendopeptidase family protein [Halomonas subglaciescola]SHM26585.1 Septal ring factor EnvC, activator of murein hydrolases AmiA and AmiB [Halomonas subglaciescola]